MHILNILSKNDFCFKIVMLILIIFMCVESKNITIQITITTFFFLTSVLRPVLRKDNTMRKQKISWIKIRHDRHWWNGRSDAVIVKYRVFGDSKYGNIDDLPPRGPAGGIAHQLICSSEPERIFKDGARGRRLPGGWGNRWIIADNLFLLINQCR